MGALHDGHLSLVEKAKAVCEEVVVSIFVNPTQFGPNEDYSKYPRPLEADLEACARSGVDWVFIPEKQDMFLHEPTMIHVPRVTDLWDGVQRPGHFDGVATVVSKLFNLVRPTDSFFGLKDLQQCMVIRKMVADMNHTTRLHLCETVRETSGLALSSRNRYLTDTQREVAANIHQVLEQVKALFMRGGDVSIQLKDSTNLLESLGFTVDYLAMVELPLMIPITKKGDGYEYAVICAARLGSTRLIDNVLVNI